MNEQLFLKISFLHRNKSKVRSWLNEDMPPYPSTSNGWHIGPPGQDGATRGFTTHKWILLSRKTRSNTLIIFNGNWVRSFTTNELNTQAQRLKHAVRFIPSTCRCQKSSLTHNGTNVLCCLLVITVAHSWYYTIYVSIQHMQSYQLHFSNLLPF